MSQNTIAHPPVKPIYELVESIETQLNAHREDSYSAKCKIENADFRLKEVYEALRRIKQQIETQALVSDEQQVGREQAAYNRGREDEEAKQAKRAADAFKEGYEKGCAESRSQTTRCNHGHDDTIEGCVLDGKLYRVERLKLALAICKGVPDEDLKQVLAVNNGCGHEHPPLLMIMQKANALHERIEDLARKNRILSALSRVTLG